MDQDGCWPRFVHRIVGGLRHHRRLLVALLLGQGLSLLLCGTGVTAQLLEQDHSLSVPTTQAFVNYTLLGAVFGVSLATTKNFLTIVRQNWWKYLLLGVVDLEANYLVILAYKYTNLTSVQLLDSFTIASVMVLSFVFLRVRFKLINFVGVVLSLIGILSMVMADYSTPCSKAKGTNQLIGDLLCLGGAVLYAVSNVAQEFLVKHHSIPEYLGMLGVSGSIVSAIQLLVIERATLVKVEWSQTIGLLFGGFGVSLFLFYSTMPYVMKYSSAVVVNLSLLTADIYALFIGFFLFHCKFSLFYILALILVILAVLIYNLKPPGVAKTTTGSQGSQTRQVTGGANKKEADGLERGGVLEKSAEASQYHSSTESKSVLQNMAGLGAGRERKLSRSLDTTIRRNMWEGPRAIKDGQYGSYHGIPTATSVYSDGTPDSFYDNQDRTYERLEESFSSGDESDHDVFSSRAPGSGGRRLSASIRRQSKAGLLNYGTTRSQLVLPAMPPDPPFPFYSLESPESGSSRGESWSGAESDGSEEIVTVHLDRTEPLLGDQH